MHSCNRRQSDRDNGVESEFTRGNGRNISNEWDYLIQIKIRGDQKVCGVAFGKNRTLCRMLQKAVAKKNPEEYEPWEKALMCAVGQKCDWTDRAYLDPILDYSGISR